MTVKAIPNLITISRIVMSLAILLTEPFSAAFFVLYILCGLSDIADGFFARKLNAQSKSGALLDSISDIVFTAVVFVVACSLEIPLWAWLWTAGIAVFRIATAIIGYLRFHKAAFTHTVANKAVGLLLFAFPIFYLLLGVDATAILLCITSSAASVEEMLIMLSCDKYLPDRKSIFHKTLDKKEKM